MSDKRNVIRVFVLFFLVFNCCFAFSMGSKKQAQECKVGLKKELIYQNDFSEPNSIDDWVLEGPGRIRWEKGKMIMIPLAQSALLSKWEKNGREPLSGKEFYGTVEDQILKTDPNMLKKLYARNGRLLGGHIVSWNKEFVTGNSYVLEYDFKPLSPIGLAIIFFSAEGENGEDVLSDSLKSRNGVFERYTQGDIDSYHISYWANYSVRGIRGTSNLRKNSGFYLLATGRDYISEVLDYSKHDFEFEKTRIKLVKKDNRIKFYMDDKLVIDFADKGYNDVINGKGEVVKEDVDTGPVHEGGRIGLRQMSDLKAEYSNLKVYRLK